MSSPAARTSPPYTSTFRALADYWWIAFRRTWRHNSASAVLALCILAALARGVINPAIWATPLRATTSLVVATASVIAFSSATQRASLFRSLRFELAPVDRDALFMARLLFGNPVRTLAAAALLVWGSRIAVSDQHLVIGILDMLCTVSVVGLAVVIDETRSSSQRARSSWAAALASVAYIALVLWTAWLFGQSLTHEPRGPSALAAALFTSGDVTGRLPGTIVLLAALAAIIVWARRSSAPMTHVQRGRSSSARFAGPLQKRRLVFIWPGAPWLAREVAILTRFTFARVALLITSCVAAFAVLRDTPLVLTGIGIGWIGAMHNAFGVDLPNGGVMRHALVGWSDARVITRRHVAMAVATLIAATVTIVIAWVAVPHPPSSHAILSYAASLSYGVSAYFLFAVYASWSSVRTPQPIHRRRARALTAEHVGSASEAIRMLVAWAVTMGIAALIVAASNGVLARWTGATDAALIMACAANLCVWRIGSSLVAGRFGQ